MKQTSKNTIRRILSAVLCAALLLTSGTVSVLATTMPAMIEEHTGGNTAASMAALPTNMASGSSEVQLSEEAEALLKDLRAYDTFTEEEKQTILALLLPGYDKAEIEDAAGQTKAAIIREFEKMPEEAQAELKIYSYMEAGKSFSDLEDVELATLYSYLDIRSDAKESAAQILRTLEREGTNLFDSMQLLQISSDGLFTVAEAKELLNRYDSRMERDGEINSFREFTVNFKKPVSVTSASLVAEKNVFSASETVEHLRKEKAEYLDEKAFTHAKQLLMNGVSVEKIRAAYSVGAALEISPDSLVAKDGNTILGSGIAMEGSVTSLLSSEFKKAFPINLEAAETKLRSNQNSASLMNKESVSQLVTTEEELLRASVEMQSALYNVIDGNGNLNDANLVNPPFLADLTRESGVSLNTGAAYHEVPLVNIPGVNGKDLALNLSYSSDRANLADGTPANNSAVLHYYAYIGSAIYVIVGNEEFLYNRGSFMPEVGSVAEGNAYISNIYSLYHGVTQPLGTPHIARKTVTDIRSYTKTISGTYSPFTITGESTGTVPGSISYSDAYGYTGIMYPYYDGIRFNGDMVQTGDNTWSITTTIFVQYSGEATYTSTSGVHVVESAYVTGAVAYPLNYQMTTYPELRYNVGNGWVWNLPSIEIVADAPLSSAKAYLHLPDKGRIEFQNLDPFNIGYSFYNYSVGDMTLTTDTSYLSSQGYRSQYKLSYLDNSLIYFAADGRVLAEIDRMGNAVTYAYNTSGYITGISNGFHTIALSYLETGSSRIITVTTPDGCSHVLTLTPNPVSAIGDWLLSSIQYPDGTQETYSYTNNFAYLNAQSRVPTAGLPVPYALLEQITYPTGASLVYVYGDIATISYNNILGSKQIFRVTERKWINGATEYNKQTFAYNGEYTGFSNMYMSLPQTYTYSATVQESSGAYTVYTFGSHQQPVSKQVYDANDALYKTETWSYTDAGLMKYHSTAYSLASREIMTAERWIYDNSGRVTSYYLPLSNGDEYQYNLATQYVYDDGFSKFIPYAVTYQPSISVRYEERYTPTPDGKNIAVVEVTNNNSAVVARTEYGYNSLGNIISEKKYSTPYDYSQMVYSYNGPYLSSSAIFNVTDADNSLTGIIVLNAYSYDSMGRVLTASDANGNVTRTTYDSMGRVTSVISPEGRTVTYSYNPILNTVLTTSGTDASVLTDYNAFGLVESESIPSLNLTLKTYAYDTRLRLIRESNASGQGSSGSTVYTYDSLDRPVSKVRLTSGNAEIYRENYDYTAFLGLQITESRTVVGNTNAPSITTRTLYTPWGDVFAELTEFAEGNSYGHRNYFDNTGRISAVSRDVLDGSMLNTQYELDYYGNVTNSLDNIGQGPVEGYDMLGRKTVTTTPTSTSTYYTHDQLNRLISEEVTRSTFQSRKHYYYDNVGNLILEKVSNSPVGSATITFRETSYSYDADGNLTDTVIWSDANTASYTHYEYDANGRMTKQYTGMSQPYSSGMSAANYQLTQYVYNNRGQQTALIDSLGQIETYAYDANGYLITKVLRDGKVNRLTYNALGNVVTDNIYANSTSTTPLSSKSYTYYPTGAVASVTEDGTTISYTYDERGNVLTETTGTTVNHYTYDISGNRTSHTLTSNGTVISMTTYTYDVRNRMTQTAGAQGTTTYNYNLDNARTLEATESGGGTAVLTQYSYAATGILSSMETVKYAGTMQSLSKYTYTYYMDGNVRTETDNTAGTTTTYTYDLAGRLKTEVSPAGTYSYTYDAAGNRSAMTENGTTTTYTYDKNNRLLTETKSGSVKSYTYDANGNMLTGDGATYTYDARGRQSGFVKGTTSASYTYYPTGMRKTKNANLATTNYVWDGSNMVLEYTNSASAGKVYVYGFTLISQGNSLYYIYNAHGDVVKYINSSGTVLKSYDYDAFGEEVNASSTDANPFRYAGQYFDNETGTYYLRARYYSPALGRFTQQDAWGYGDPNDPLSLNLYVYCYNDPVRYYDPSGRVVESPWDFINVGLGAGDIILDLYVGDYTSLLIDIPALLLDLGALVTPGVPGGVNTLKTPLRVGKTVKAFDKIKTAIRVGNKLDIIAKAFLRREARKFLLENSEEFAKVVAKGVKKYEVHHIIPLEWAHIMGKGFDPNATWNLAGVEDSIHKAINREWNQFRKMYKDSAPTREQVLDFAKKTLSEYGEHFIR